MELFTAASLATVAGASLAVTLVTAALKAVTNIQGRATQAVALGVSLGLACAFGVAGEGTAQAWIVALFNGVLIYCTAMGVDQMANYEPREDT